MHFYRGERAKKKPEMNLWNGNEMKIAVIQRAICFREFLHATPQSAIKTFSNRWSDGILAHVPRTNGLSPCECELALFHKIYNLIASSVKSIYQKYSLLLIPLELFIYIFRFFFNNS